MKRNSNGHEARSTKIMLSNPITEVSKLIGGNWFRPLEKLTEKTGVPLTTLKRAVQGEKILKRYEDKLRDFFNNYKGEEE